MQHLNYYQLFFKILPHYFEEDKKDIIIEISLFNKFVEKMKSHNIICDFDFYDLEEYARSLPEAHCEYSKLIFHSSSTWVKNVKKIANYYTLPTNHITIIDIWKEVNL